MAARDADVILAETEREDHSWSDGVLGALAGLPWALLYLATLRSTPTAPAEYPVLDALGFQVLILVQWPVYGFFYGDAFALLRGSNAIFKALTVVVTAVVPVSLTTLLVWRPEDVCSQAFFALQMLAFGLVLGGTFEISILRRDAPGFGWGDIVSRYRPSGIVRWASSLAVAVSAAIITAVSTGVGGLITNLFSQVKVGAPTSGPPPQP